MASRSDRFVEHTPARTSSGFGTTVRLLNPIALFENLWDHRELIIQLSTRDVLSRYRGSYLGLAWSFLNPLMMLTVFTLVFGVIFRHRWGVENENQLDFALVLFSGLIIFNVFAECVSRAPSLVLAQPQYVKRVVFPLEILPVTALLSAVAHALVSLLVLLIGLWLSSGQIHWTVVFLPLVVLPLLFLCLGIGWFLASLGVFFRDIGHVIGVLTTAILFLSPIFYPVSAIPGWLQPFYRLNPLTFIIEDTRAVVIWGQLPHWWYFLPVFGGTLVAALFGYAWFQRTRKGFADVL